MNNNIILNTKLVGEIEGNFNVPTYQRGYRWSEDEVTRLLDDVFYNGKKNYCLQPVVVRKNGNAFDIIDGQQRLTTLYLIYKYLHDVNTFFHEPKFSLTYDTRNQSADFLKTIDLSKLNDNIDFWFMGNAYTTIQNWFEKDLQIRAMHIFEYFKENVKIIWYEVDENEDAISLFTRLNIGKIPLTSAELIKAMFLSRDNSKNIDRKKQDEIALQWDNIEKELHNDSLWYFLTNNNKKEYQTRIDLILDLIADKPNSIRDKYYTFFEFDKRYSKDKNSEDLWRQIQQTFLVLKDWYENHELYHKIGYLIASNKQSLYEIYKISENKTKVEFKNVLNRLIKESIHTNSNYSDLYYNNRLDYNKISTLLLLFNVESVRQNGENTQWFPFDKFKYSKRGKTVWSLEHIHAQHSEGMRTQEVWKEWLTLHIPSVKAVGNEHDKLIQEMQNAIYATKLDRNEFDAIQQKVIKVLSVSGNMEYLDSIANLALLNTADNSALSNSTFDVKRNIIIDMDKRGQYIPFCTKMVFLKYYTPSESNQLHFWGQEDRIAYLKAINTVLTDYLDEPIILEMEDVK